jgi:N-acyl-D-aspartate/D-glutamate deacylase
MPSWCHPNGNPVVNYGDQHVIGDCGASCAPVPPKSEPRQVLVQYLRRVLDKYVDDKDWKWQSFGDYLNYIEGKIGVNVLPLMPHSPVRLTVMGEAAYAREANTEELNAMKQWCVKEWNWAPSAFHQPAGRPAIHAGTPRSPTMRSLPCQRGRRL